ncbi:MAG TPA: ABC transporter permease [Armatimonadota bacterium]|jgi:putative ABC transport system permease protein
MIPLESLSVALRSLGSNKLRTGLTMLGIIIGVGAVISVLAIGQGATQRVTSSISALGTNMLTVIPGSSRVGGGPGGGGGQVTTLTLDDATAIGHNLAKTVALAAPATRDGVTVRLGHQNTQSSCVGTTPAYAIITNSPASSGRFLTEDDVSGRLKVAVIGVSVILNLFGTTNVNPIGMEIQLNQVQFRVVGVLTPKGSGAFGQDQDNIVIIPVSTALRRLFNRTYINTIYVEAVSPDPAQINLVSDEISSLLRRRHHLLPPFPDNDDFSVRSQSALLQTSETVTGTLTALLAGIAVVSLIVGGIGIMNIMIVSVTERTREIGIRKAVGATGRDILVQFLTESLVVSVLGGLIGIAFGILGSVIVGKALGWTTVVTTRSVLLAFLVSAAVGIFFGIYPARKASQLHPIDALRYE